MEKTKKIMEIVSPNFKDKDRAQLEKFLTSLSLANENTLEILQQYEVVLSKSSQLKVLTIDPKTITQTLELANKMSFIDAYKENPARLCQQVTAIISRMAKCDANGVSYKKEDGTFENFLFSKREFDQKLQSLNILSEPIVKESSEQITTDLGKLNEYATRVMETFGLVDEKENILQKVSEVSNMGFGYKETLMEVFKTYGGNTQLLSDSIDEILGLEENVSLGRAA